MANYYDVIAGIQATWSRFRDNEVLKWAAVGALTPIVSIIGMLVAVLGLAAVVAGEKATFQLPGVVGLIALLFGLALFVLGVFGWLKASLQMYRTAMRVNGIPIPAKSPSLWRWLLLKGYCALINLFAWYDKKLIAPGAVSVTVACIMALAALVLKGVLTRGAFIGLAVVFGLFGVMLWSVGAAVHGVRTQFAAYRFVRGGGIKASPRESAQLVRGQTLEVFLPGLALGLMVGIIGFAIEIMARTLLYAAMLPSMFMGSLIPLAGADWGSLLVPLAVGVGTYVIIQLIWGVISGAFGQVYLASVFGFFDKAGPAKPEKKKN